MNIDFYSHAKAPFGWISGPQILKSIAFTICAFLWVIPASHADSLSDIESEGGKWARFYEAEDLSGLMTLYVDDVVVALHGQPALFGKAAVEAYFAERLGKAISTFELDYELRETHGDIAYIISKYWLKAVGKETGEVYRETGRSLLVYKKHEGQWKIAADIDQATPDVTWPAPSGLE